MKMVMGIEMKKEYNLWIREVCDKCKICLSFNNGKPGFQPIKNFTANYPLHHICMDILMINNEATSSGKVGILVVVDVFSRFVFLFPICDKSALSVFEALSNLISNFGFFDIISSDNGKENDNWIINKLMDVFKVKKILSIPYYHQGNGIVEAQNKIVLNVVLKVCAERLGNVKEWDKIICQTQFYINQKINLLSNTNAFSLMFGRNGFNSLQLNDIGLNKNLILGVDDGLKMEKIFKDNWLVINKVVYPELIEKIKIKQLKNNVKVDGKRRLKDYICGEIVMVKIFKKNKTDFKWMGPLKIKCKLGDGFTLVSREGKIIFNQIPSINLTKCSLEEDDVLSNKEIEDFTFWKEGEIINNEKEDIDYDTKVVRREGLRDKSKINYKLMNNGLNLYG
jgi:hypothetical protein